MSSYLTLPYREQSAPGSQLHLSQQAAERFALLEAVRAQRYDQLGVVGRQRVGERLRRALTGRARARHGTSPA